MKQEFLLKIAFSCMACDGNIAEEEMNYLYKNFGQNNVIRCLVDSLKTRGAYFFTEFFTELERSQFTKEDELEIIKTSIDVIESDNSVEYSEIKFFKIIRSYLKISNKDILEYFPDKEDYIYEDVKRNYIDEYLLEVKDFDFRFEIK
ncbi:MAG: TerB family tellurite resistance protein [Bacteroidales bacterium]|nr:TerB family tellurite resistance protein [Bacteroidales bacterium]